MKIYRVIEDFQNFYRFLLPIYFCCVFRHTCSISTLFEVGLSPRLFVATFVPRKSSTSLFSSPNFLARVLVKGQNGRQLRSFSNGHELTHVNEHGKATMVDISRKPITIRHAVAVGRILMNERAFKAVKNNTVAKGDVLTVAEIAGIMGAKKCSELIPLCHSLSLTNVDIKLTLNSSLKSIDIEANASTADRTGVEMESLTAVTIAALTIYDMCKALGKDAVIGDVMLKQKSGGVGGDYSHSSQE